MNHTTMGTRKYGVNSQPGLCTTCAHEPAWREVEDFIAGFVERGRCAATGVELDRVCAEGRFELIGPDGPLARCERWRPK